MGRQGFTIAKKLDCTRQAISQADKGAMIKLRKLYYESHPEGMEMNQIEIEQEEIELTREEKIEAKEVLKNLILTELTPQQKKTMLCKFYSTTRKTNQQVAQETNLTEPNVRGRIRSANKKLCAIYNGIKDQKHLTSKALKDILKFQIEEPEKER